MSFLRAHNWKLENLISGKGYAFYHRLMTAIKELERHAEDGITSTQVSEVAFEPLAQLASPIL